MAPVVSPFTRRRSFHKGVDLQAPIGARVNSAADGVVVAAGRNGAYGLSVDVFHGSGILTRYSHLSDIHIARGDKVCQGQTIGLVGSTGRSTGPHLHFEIQVNGRAVDPVHFLSSMSDLLTTSLD